MNFHHEALQKLAKAIFSKAGCEPPEDEQLAHHLVDANLVGHDSHGLIRITRYIEWLQKDMVRVNRKVSVVFESEVISVLDGDLGFGQSTGEQAMKYAIDKVGKHGVSILALRNCGHLGRIGEWAAMGARAGYVSLHWVNTTGFGILVAPHGGNERRLSANPLAAGVPLEGKDPIVLDISTCAIAEGKVRVAFNKGETIPPNCLIDGQGNPTTNPADLYADPKGSLLSFGAHKGYGLSILTDILAGALTGSGCSTPGTPALVNGMLVILLDPAAFGGDGKAGLAFTEDVQRFVEWVKSARTADPNGEILLPGEIEERTRAKRLQDGIEIDDKTWGDILASAESLGMARSEAEALARV
jgi:uncharacterized oxidoreductase